MSYVVELDAFHGPLDLLLYLIEKNQVDIYDIPIALLSDQFMAYLDGSEGYALDVIGDFLVMASYLLQMKARMLLPPLVQEDEEPEADPREELVKRLEEYKRFKEAAGYLMARQDGEVRRVFFRSQGFEEQSEVLAADLGLLMRAYQSVLERMEKETPVLSLPQEDVNVHEKMEEIIQILAHRGTGMHFSELFEMSENKRQLLGLFLALLELVRLQKVEAVQKNKFGDILLYLQVVIDDVDER